MNEPHAETTFSVICTGDELVTGETADTNAAFISRRLDEQGFLARRLVTVGDDPDRLSDELTRAVRDSDVVVVTGGLGPTADDRSRRAIAAALGVELVQDESAADHVRRLTARHGREAGARDLSQAAFPEGARVIPNPRGTAAGFACKLDASWVVALPGVPSEMEAMFTDTVLPLLREEVRSEGRVAVRMVNLFGLPEAEVDSRVSDLTARGRNPSVAPTARSGVIRLCVRARSEDRRRAEELADRDVETIRERFGDLIFGYGEQTLAHSVKESLERRGLTLAVAESCTGGLVGDMLTDVPGVSAVLLADVVAYADEVKVRTLGVPREQIEDFGAVSAPVAESMAAGACDAAGADVGVSTTGIAGPSGGTPRKPVGLVYVGLCVRGRTSSRSIRVPGDRRRVKDRASRRALNAVRLALLRQDGGDV